MDCISTMVLCLILSGGVAASEATGAASENRMEAASAPAEKDVPGAPQEEEAEADEALEKLLEEAEELAEEETSTEEGRDSPLVTELTQRLNEFNPRITVFGDFLGRIDDSRVLNEDGNEVGDRFSLREVEVDFRADVDPFAKAVMIAAFEEETPNEYKATIEEGYVTFESLPWALRAKVGRFRTPFGTLNKLHLHDLPQTTLPLPLVNFLGAEGDIQNGIEVSRMLPWAPVTVTLDVLNGENAAVLAGSDARLPAVLGHAGLFVDLNDDLFMEVGGSHLFGYSDEDGTKQTNLSGLDFLLRWRPRSRGRYRSLVLQSELFYLNREIPGDRVESIGFYAMAQVQLGRPWYLGARYDYSQLPDRDDDDFEWGGGVFLSHYTTEFLRLRVGYEHTERAFEDHNDTVYFQLTFVFGSHPVEPYWFNR